MELMAFFAGFPLIYAIVYAIAGVKHKIAGSFSNRLTSSLSFAYALTGTLFLGLLLKDLYPDYSAKNIAFQFQTPYLILWGISSVLCWIPFFHKKKLGCLLHSLVFFFLLLKDLFMSFNGSIDKDMIQNDMKLYTTSLFINTGTFLFILIFRLMIPRLKTKEKSAGHRL